MFNSKDVLFGKNVLDDITNRFKNKVVYLDFWATWCGPCVREFPNSKKLEETFAGKDVVFVYVCFKSNYDKWKKDIKTYELNENQYFLNTEASNEFSNKFKINGFPTYYLIDKNGQIYKDVTRPSDERTKEKINELLTGKK